MRRQFRLFGAGVSSATLAEKDFTGVGTSRLAPPPVNRSFRWSEAQADFTTRGIGVNLKALGRMRESEVWKNLLGGKIKENQALARLDGGEFNG